MRSVKLGDVTYRPSADQPAADKEIRLTGPAPAKDDKLRAPGATGTAEATLADGRSLPVSYTVDAPRPLVELLTTSARMPVGTGLVLSIGSKSDLPLTAYITMALRSMSPARFPRGEKLEVALADGSLRALLSFSDGSLVLQDARTALAFFSPAKAFGASAFGPLQARAVAEDGTVGDWLPLGTLVRTPEITGLTCARPAVRPSAAAKTEVARPDDALSLPEAAVPCTLAGRDLFLIASVGADSSFSTAVPVEIGFTGDSLSVPRPADGRTIFLKLRDDPDHAVSVDAGRSHRGVAAPATTPAASQ